MAHSRKDVPCKRAVAILMYFNNYLIHTAVLTSGGWKLNLGKELIDLLMDRRQGQKVPPVP